MSNLHSSHNRFRATHIVFISFYINSQVNSTLFIRHVELLPKPSCILSIHSLCAASGWRQKTTVGDFSLIFPQIFHTPSSTRAQPQLSVFEPCWMPHHTCLTFHKITISHQQPTAVTSVSRLMTSATDLTPSQHSILVTPSHQRHNA